MKPDDPNHLAKFEFAFMAPNSCAGAGIEIKGQADADGKTPADDVTGFKKITFQLYAKGAETIRVEAISRGHGVDLQAGYPQMSFKVKPGPEHLRGGAEGARPARLGRREGRSQEDPAEADRAQHHRVSASSSAGPPRGC